MAHFVGLDVSVQETAVCVVDEAGKVVFERKVATEPDDLVGLLTSISGGYGRIGIEPGPLSQWLVNGLAEAGLPGLCVETRHMNSLLKAQQVDKSDRHDARGIAQMMRVGLFKPVLVKTLASQERRMLLTSRKLLQRKMLDIEFDLRGTCPSMFSRVCSVAASSNGLPRRMRQASSPSSATWPRSMGPRRSPARWPGSAGSTGSSTPSRPSARRSMCWPTLGGTLIVSPSPTTAWSPQMMTASPSAGATIAMATPPGP